MSFMDLLMKSMIAFGSGLLLAAAGQSTSLHGATNTALHIHQIAQIDDRIQLAWSGGRSPYQVQTRNDFHGPWTNMGGPTSQTNYSVPLKTARSYFRVVADYTARYSVTFNATWSQSTHPLQWPAGAHWSGLVGGTHNESVHFWREGEAASEGIRLMAERGQQATLLSEIAPNITKGVAQLQLAGSGIGTSPGSVSMIFPQPMTRDFPLVTLVTMIAPSPDWFAGVDGLSLIEDGDWVSSKTVPVYGYDAGTDSGVSYSSPDQVTAPRRTITRFTGFPAVSIAGRQMPFGTFSFTRLDAPR